MKRLDAAFLILGTLLCAAVLLHCGGSEVVGRGGSEVVGKLTRVAGSDTVPAPGAIVSLYKDSFNLADRPIDSVTTDKNGNFVVFIGTPGSYFLYGHLTKDSLVAFIPDVAIDSVAEKPGDPYQYHAGTHVLLPPGSVSGRATVYSGENGLILVDIPSLSYQAHTDDSGKFTISNIPPGRYVIRYSTAGFIPYSTDSVTITSGRDTLLASVMLELDPNKPVPAPLGLTAAPDTKNGTVTLRWNRVPVSDLYGYIIARGSGSDLPVVLDTILSPDTSYSDIVYNSSNDTLSKTFVYTVKSIDRTSSASVSPSSVTVHVESPFTVKPVFQRVPGDTTVEYGGTVVATCRVFCRVDFKVLVLQPGTPGWTEISCDATGLAGINFSTGSRSVGGLVSIRAVSTADTADTSFRVKIRPRPVTIVSADSTDSSVTVGWNRSPDSDFGSYRLYYRAPGSAGDSLITLSRVADTFSTIRSFTNGIRGFSVEVADTEGLVSLRSSVKSIGIKNTPPRFSVDTSGLDDSIAVGTESRFAPDAGDANGDTLSFSLGSTGLDGLSILDDDVVFKPVAISLAGQHRIVVFVNDRHGGVDSLVWNVRVVAHDVWAPGDSLINARRLFGAVTLNGKIYVVGGQVDNLSTGRQTAIKTVEMYDTLTGRWTQKASLTTARWGLMVAASASNNKIYAFGGSNEKTYVISSIEEYDPVTDSWTPAGTMPFYRSGGAACVIGNNLYCIGGKAYDASKGFEAIVKSIAVCDLNSKTWSNGPLMRNARSYHRVCVYNGLVYVVGGTGAAVDSVDELTDGNILNTMEVFNPAGTGRCDSLMTLQNPRSNFGGANVGNLIFCIGGLQSLTESSLLPVEIANVTLKNSTLKSLSVEQRYSHQSVELGGRIYCIGGVLGTGNSSRSVTVYYP